jgi:integrase
MVVEALAEQLQRQEAAGQRAGVLWQDNELVFTTALGTQLDAADVRRSLRTICRKAGIAEEWTPRELRHTFVSLLSDNGMAIEEISRLVGHSSSNITETVYRHQIRPVGDPVTEESNWRDAEPVNLYAAHMTRRQKRPLLPM